MSSFSGPFNEGTVTRGLVLSYDADELASYPGSGTTITDLSGNGKNGTISGATYSSNYNSVYFDGSGDFLQIAGLPANYLNSDFTIEGWVNITAQQSQMFFNTIPHASFGISLNRGGSGQTALYIGNGTSWLTSDFRSTGTISTNQWTHVAVTRRNNTITIWHNGMNQGSTTANMPSGYSTAGYIGTYNGATGENVQGYISNFRIVFGTALYTANFTPPSRVTPTQGTILLTCQGSFTDTSSNKTGVSVNGNASLNTLSPFKNNYKNFTFNGSSSVITTSISGLTGYYSIDAVFKLTSVGAEASDIVALTAGSQHGLLFEIAVDRRVRFLHRYPYGGSGGDNFYTTEILDLNRVYNVTLVRDTRQKIYINGVKVVDEATTTTNFDSTLTEMTVGQISPFSASRLFNGELYNLKMYNRALATIEVQQNYDSNCEKYGLLPTQSIASVASSGLILYYDAGNESSYPKSGTTIYDLSSSKINGTLVNGVGYGSDNGGILSFDGVDDKITFPSTTLQTSAGATIEVWFKTPSTTRYQDIFDTDDTAGGVWMVTQSGQIKTSFTTTTGAIGTNYSADTWYHVVLTGAGTTAYQYINGVQTGTGTQTVPKTINIATARIGNVDGDRASEYLLGNVASFKIYNRQLSAQEIQQNFEADRTRFRV